MSGKQKNNYTLEFKISAVKLALESGKPAPQIARDLGIKDNTLYGWIKQYSNFNQTNQKEMNVNNESYFEENKHLEKELALVKQERDLLEKAAAYLAKESQ